MCRCRLHQVEPVAMAWSSCARHAVAWETTSPKTWFKSKSRLGARVRLVSRLVCWSTACGGCTGRMCCVLERRGVSVCKQESEWGWLLININGVCVNWSEKCRMQIRAMMEPWGSVWAMASPALRAGGGVQ